MLTTHLKKVAERVVEKTNALIQFSTNLNEEGQRIGSGQARSTLVLQHKAALARKKQDDLNIIQQIQDWHLDLAKKENDFFFQSSTYIIRTKQGRKELKEYLIGLNDFDDKKEGRLFKFLKKDEPLRACEEIAANAVRFNVGNCQEKTFLALLLFREFPNIQTEGVDKAVPVSILSFIPPIDKTKTDKSHAFLILNLTQGSINEPSTWNEDAIICDPWTKEVYTIKEARMAPEKLIIWQDILAYKEYIKSFPLPSHVGAEFNKEPHSAAWIKRAEKLRHDPSSTKWWKANDFFNQERPVLTEVEEKKLILK